jgi:hypothetical protein
VYTRTNGVWTQQGDKLVGTGAVGPALQGFSVALSSDGNTAVVGGPVSNGDIGLSAGPGDNIFSIGAAWVYTRTEGVWTQQGEKLVGTGAVGTSQQGFSVSLSGDGDTALVGGRFDNGLTGATWVYTRTGGVWTQQGDKLVGTGAVGALQGSSVALSGNGNTALVGGPLDNRSQGATWVFTRASVITQYQFVPLTGSTIFSVPTATGISDNGSVIGYLNSPTDSVVFTRPSGIVLRLNGLINGINASGDIVGQLGAHPFVSKPPYNSLFDLAPVFGWTFGNGVAINDRGDIIATGGPPDYKFDQWFPALNITDAVTINNLGQVIGRQANSTYLYTPGQGVTTLPAIPLRLNNEGHLLYSSASDSFIQTTTGQIPLPSGYSWVAMNDADEVVGFASDSTSGEPKITPVYYSASAGLINLNSRTLNSGDYQQFTPAAINNKGEIAVTSTWSVTPSGTLYGGVGVLVPAVPANMNRTSEISGQRVAGQSRSDYTLNGEPVRASAQRSR